MRMRVVRAALLPVVVCLVVPWLLLRGGGGEEPERETPAIIALILRLFGVLAAGLGLGLLLQTIHMFATVGRGTLAPWDPPQTLVVGGVYRYVRNPMISGVLALLLGESLLLLSGPLFAWFLIAVLINAIYIPLLEEPGLVRRFGEAYVKYQKHVPRWIPRLTPWDPATADE